MVSIFGAIVLVLHFEHRFKGFVAQISYTLFQSMGASIAAGAGAYGILLLTGPLTLSSTTASVLSKGFVAGVIGIIVAALTYALLRSRELGEIVATLRGRFVPGDNLAIEVPITSSAEEAGTSISH
jgi:hypothetical protein